MDETPDTFVQVGDALPPWLADIRRKMDERKKKAA
jgi:hypothetical protein